MQGNFPKKDYFSGNDAFFKAIWSRSLKCWLIFYKIISNNFYKIIGKFLFVGLGLSGYKCLSWLILGGSCSPLRVHGYVKLDQIHIF